MNELGMWCNGNKLVFLPFPSKSLRGSKTPDYK